MNRLIRFLLVLGTSLCLGRLAAQDAEQPEFLSVPSIKGLVFLADQEKLAADGVTNGTAGVVVQGIADLDSPQFREAMSKYLGRALSVELMKEMQTEIVLYLRSIGRPIAEVFYFEQTVADGILQVVVKIASLGAIDFRKVSDPAKGMRGWEPYEKLPEYEKNHLLKQVRLKPGEPIDEPRLLRDADWLSRSPFRDVQIGYKAGDKPFTSDVLLGLERRRPYTAAVGYEDTGSRPTSLERVYVDIMGGRPFLGGEHFLSYRFFADPALDHLRAHIGNYTALLPWRHSARITGFYIDTEGELGRIAVKGRAYQISPRYDIPLPVVWKLQHEMTIGIDYKSLENGLSFNNVAIVDTPWDVFQVTPGYTVARSDPFGRTSLNLGFVYSPGGIGSNGTEDAYALLPRSPKTSYFYTRIGGERVTALFPTKLDMRWVVRGSAQFADGSLTPSEQYGLGGVGLGGGTVRGFDERDVNKDEGWNVSTELYSPALSLLQWTKKSYLKDEIRFLGFFDYGRGSNVTPGPGEIDSELMSAGVGLRWVVNTHLDLRLDYAWQLQDKGSTTPDKARAHISAVLRF